MDNGVNYNKVSNDYSNQRNIPEMNQSSTKRSKAFSVNQSAATYTSMMTVKQENMELKIGNLNTNNEENPPIVVNQNYNGNLGGSNSSMKFRNSRDFKTKSYTGENMRYPLQNDVIKESVEDESSENNNEKSQTKSNKEQYILVHFLKTLNNVKVINNYLGFDEISGNDLAIKMFNHISHLF